MGYQKGLFYYTSVLTFSEIFFLFGELQHILFAEVFLQIKKDKKKRQKKGQHVLNSEGIPDAFQHSCFLFIHFTVITVVKREKKLIREL